MSSRVTSTAVSDTFLAVPVLSGDTVICCQCVLLHADKVTITALPLCLVRNLITTCSSNAVPQNGPETTVQLMY